MAKANKVLLIGWDAADWTIIDPLLAQGKMPALKKLMNRGVSGRIATLDPPYSPMLWTSVITGKTPDKHGILNFTEPAPREGGIRPVLSTSRNCKALWNILTHLDKKSNLVCWWPSHPVEPINGVMVSDLFPKAASEIEKPWPVNKSMVHPRILAPQMAQLRVHPEEITPAHIHPFIPLAEEIDQKEDKHLKGFVNITAHCATIQNVSTWLLQNTEWDFMGIYLDGIDHYCHGFVKFHPPKLPGITDKMFNIYKGVVDGGYVFHDMMLERLMNLIDEDTTVILMSDHGFYSDHLRLTKLPDFNAAPALEHRPYGIFCMAGPNIKKGEKVYGASLLDVLPTILSHMDIPIGRDMDGKVLTDVFETPSTPTFIDSWESVEGHFGEHAAEAKEDPVAAHEAMQQLVALGYVEDPGEDKAAAAHRTKNDIRFNLAMVYKGKNELHLAIPIIEELLEASPEEFRYLLELCTLYLKTNNNSEAGKLIEKLKKHKEKEMVNLPLLESKYFLGKNQPFQALQCLKEAEKKVVKSPNLHLELGRIYLVMHRFQEAENAYRIALEKDHESAHGFHGLAVSLLRQGKAEEAAEEALNALDLLYYFPNAHYILGEALEKCAVYPEAAQAYEVALQLSPGMLRARKAVANLYETHLDQIENAKAHQEILKKSFKGVVTIVSGMPASGSEELVEVLQNNGLEFLDKYTNDALKDNPESLNEAIGKLISLEATALKRLPKNYLYKVVFMNRNMSELLTAFQREHNLSEGAYPTAAAASYKKELERIEVWQNKEPQVEFFSVNYSDWTENKSTYLGMIKDFIG